MNSSHWRDSSNIVISDSEDEIPGSRDASDLEDVSRLERGSISIPRIPRPAHGSNTSKTIINDTDSEEDDEDEEEDDNRNNGSLNRGKEANESVDGGWMNLIDKNEGSDQEMEQDDSESDESEIVDKMAKDGGKDQKKKQEDPESDESDIIDKKAQVGGKDQKKMQDDSDAEESIVRPKRKVKKPILSKSDIVDEESESSEEISEASDNSNSENYSDDDYNATGNTNDSAISEDLPIRKKKDKPSKFVIEDNSSDEESTPPSRPGPKSSKPSPKADYSTKLEDTQQHITLDDSVEITSITKNIPQSTFVELEDSIDDQSSSDHLPLSISNSSAPEIAISLANEESPANGVDPLLLQKRALDSFKLGQLKKDLLRAKTLYNTANREQLPDRGEKLRQSIESMQNDVQRLSIQIERTSLNLKPGSPLMNLKTEPPRLSPQAQIRADFDAAQFIKPEKELGKQAQATFEREQALTVERLNHLQQSLNRCPEEDDRAEDPRGLKTKLMPHQQHALAWMLWREKEKPPGGLLADDMGLGKTLTMISLVVATKDESYSDSSDSDEQDEDDRWYSKKRQGRPKGGTLVVCPASLLDQWQNEVTNRCRRGILTVEVHHGQRREAVPKRLAKNDMVITTYQLVASEFKRNSALFRIRWKRIILDEAHIIRNHAGKISEAVCKLSARNRWALTGTPIHNKEQDLYALLKFIRVTPFNDIQVWKRWVDNKNQTGLKRLATVTKTLMLRRTKQELIAKGTLEELPEKFTTLIDVNLDPEETKIYQSVLAFSQTLFAQFLAQRAEKEHMKDLNAGKFDKPAYMAEVKASHFAAAQKQLLGRKGEDVKAHHILVLILRLRQICCHPGLIREMLNAEEAEANGIIPEEEDVEKDLVAQVNNMTLVEDDENEDQNEENLFSLKNPVFMFTRQSSKIKAVLDTVESILEKGEKMIVVSQWTGMLKIISAHLAAIEGATHEMFSGSVPIKKRQGIVDRFNDQNDELMILLLSLTAGGVGLNLVGGNHLLLIDIHWNPQLESQAQDRIYRFGQKKNVNVYKFMCNETIEQRVRQLQEKKLNLAEDIFTGHRRTSNKLSLEDLKSIFEM